MSLANPIESCQWMDDGMNGNSSRCRSEFISLSDGVALPSSMVILLVRHALAVPRRAWDGDDARRPLTSRGKRQASGLGDVLKPFEIERIVASPTTRCKATVAPAAMERHFPVKTSKLLLEGRGQDALDLVLDVVGDVVVCTHGDVIEVVLHGLRRLGWPIP